MTQRSALRRLGIAAVALLGMAATTSALAQHWHRPRASVGIYVGPGYYGPGWYGPRPWGYYGYPYGYGYPYPYPPPVVTVPSAPVYIERNDAPVAAAPTEPGYWYYCRNPAGYYPTVQECPGGAWERVPPQPPVEQSAPAPQSPPPAPR